ncbi:unnamed protein product [Sphagnum tenellum]
MNYPILTINERRLNYKFMAGEAFWILSGDNSVDGIARYCKEMAGYSDDGVTLFGAYGPRIFNQMPYILVKLRQDIHSRQAVINIWRESPPLDTKNPPCDTQLQFLIRDDKLHLVLTSCSSDIWRGLPYDIFNFVMVTTWLLFDLKGKYHDLELGYLYYNIGSLHLYKTDEVEAKIIVDSHNSYSLEYQDFVFNWQSNWKPLPQVDWPDLSGATYIALDTETFDPNLQDKGPGFIRKDAGVIGISLATDLGHKLYLPIDHVEDNVDRVQAIRYLREQLSRPNQAKVAEPLLDEDKEGGYSLENLSRQYLGYGKDESLLRQAAADYGLDSKKHMRYLPARFVGEYATVDAENALLVFMEQVEALKADDLWDIFLLEQELQPILFQMRLLGVRVDLDYTERLVKEAKANEAKQYLEICKYAGFKINVASTAHLSRFFEKEGLSIPVTAKGNPSITGDWLKQQTTPWAKKINDYRVSVKVRKDFLEGMILNENVNGRLHSCWHQLRKTSESDSDDVETDGTRTGRLSSSHVNLQHIPARDPYWGKAIRKAFIPDDGGRWAAHDISGEELRVLVHYAYEMGLTRAAEVRQRYLDNPHLDYHQAVCDLINEVSNAGIDRRQAKSINLGRQYAMGAAKMARTLNISLEDCVKILKQYDEGVPYVSEFTKLCIKEVEQKGFITTMLGRKRRFNLWEKKKRFDDKSYYQPLPRDAALKIYGEDIQRAHLHKAGNAKVQGTSADLMKKALVDLYKAGYLPMITLHDEVGTTVCSEREVKEIQETMEHAIEFSVPMVAEGHIGDNWADAK